MKKHVENTLENKIDVLLAAFDNPFHYCAL